MGRRLGSNSRRLEGNIVRFVYTIQVADAAAANDLVNKIETLTPESLQAEIKSKHGGNITFEVKSITAEAATVTYIVEVYNTTTTAAIVEEDDLEDDSHARRPAALASVVMALVAVAF